MTALGPGITETSIPSAIASRINLNPGSLIVIAGAITDSASLTAADMVGRVREFEAAGMDRKSAIATVADEFGISKRLVYAAVVDANKMSQ